MSFWPPIMCGWEWFPERKGLITGLIVGAFGYSPSIFDNISTAVANPMHENPKVPDDGSTTDKFFSE